MKSYLQVGYFFIAIIMLFSTNSCSNNEEFETDTPQAKLRSSSDFDPYAYFACDLRYDSQSNSFKDVYNKQYYSSIAYSGITMYDSTNKRYYLGLTEQDLSIMDPNGYFSATEDQFQFIEFDLEMEAYISNINGSISIVSFEDDSQNLCDLGIMYNGSKWYVSFTGLDWYTLEYKQIYYPINTPVSLNRIVKIKLTQRTDKPLVVDISGIGTFEIKLAAYINPFYISVLDLKKIYSLKIEATEE